MRSGTAGALLKVVSILLIILGAITVLILIMGLIGSAAEISASRGLPYTLIATSILMIVMSVSGLVLGIIGLRKYRDSAKGSFFVTAGIVLCVLAFASMTLSIVGVGFGFVIMGIPTAALILFGLLLSVLYIIGGSLSK